MNRPFPRTLIAACLAAALVPAAWAAEAKETTMPETAAYKGPVPTPQQVAWQDMECIAFAHFGVNTFTDKEWGDGKEDPKIFNPSALDARQWVKVCLDAGIKMIILTCKHHDGFCLWPSRYTEHSVKNSPWKDGKGDVVREVSDACREGGLRFGVYLSPWDRHEPAYGDSPKYNQHFVNQLTELLTNYGEITEVWFDGACGEGPSGKRQVYDWTAFHETVRKLQPKAVIFSDAGPGVRWIGNENGFAGETCWSMMDRAKVRVGGADTRYLNRGDPDAPDWVPGECDVSIRPGWFYHPAEDAKVKSLEQLMNIYFGSVGRNGLLLLNIPPDRRGLFHENDAARLREFRQARDEIFKTNLVLARPAKVAGDAAAAAVFEAGLGDPAAFNVAMVQEDITQGQRVEEFRLEASDGGAWKEFAKGATIGHKRLLRFPDVTAAKVRLVIVKSRGAPIIRDFGLYRAPAPVAK